MMEMAAALDALVRERFPGSRGREERVEAYLELNALLQVEDTAEAVGALRAALPRLLDEFQRDLAHAAARDVLHACLRTLSYFMYHRAMADAFPEPQSSFFLSEIVRLLFSTQDEATYKLCLWCLSMQNFDAERHRLLPRTVEGLVQAIINPFKSRPIELQALRGLHALLLKYPEQMATSPSVLGAWVRPVTSRLRSSDRATREQARLLLQEAARRQSSWSTETSDHIQACVGEYVLPAMKTLVDRDKHVEALHMWTLTVSLMRRALVEDLTVLNAVLYVPENAMGHSDAAVRLMGVQAWSHLVDAFCATDFWLFKKSVVQLLMQPVVVTLEVEPMRNIVHAAFLCWKRLVDASVRAFNAHYHDAHSVKDAHQDALKWKRWMDEVVRVPLSAILSPQTQAPGRDGEDHGAAGLEAGDEETSPFLVVASAMWSAASADGESDGPRDGSEDRMEGARPIVGGGRDPATIHGVREKDVSTIGSNAIGLAFLLPDVFAAVQMCINISEAAAPSRVRTKQRVNEVANAIWTGFCRRIWTLKAPDDMPDKLRLRLARLCLDFAVGASSSASSTSASGGQRATATALSVEWQVSLMTPLLTTAPTSDMVTALLLHPKSRVYQCVAGHLAALQEAHAVCGAIVRRFFVSGATADGRLDMARKDNVLLTLMVHLMLASAVAIDAKSNPSLPEVVHLVVAACQLCRLLLDTASAVRTASSQSPSWQRVIAFVSRCVKAADVLASSEKDDQLDSQSWHGFIELCSNATEGDEGMERQAATTSASTSSGGADGDRGSDFPVSEAKDDDTASFSALEEKDSPRPGTPDAVSAACLVRGSLPAVVSTASSSSCGSSSTSSGAADRMAAAIAPEQPEPAPHPSPEQTKATKEAATKSLLNLSSRKHQRRTPDRQTKTSTDAGNVAVAPATPTATVVGPQGTRTSASSEQEIYPPLAKCTESISMVFRYFPLGFRQLFGFYKISTIGDLSSKSMAEVKAFGIKDPVKTVLRALEDYDAKQSRSSTSSLSRQRLLLSPSSRRVVAANAAPTTPSRASPPPMRSALGKRPARHAALHLVSPLQMESPHRKRARRSLDELNNDVDASRNAQPGTDAPEDPKLADRVTFCLPTGEGDATRIARPGEESLEGGGHAVPRHGKGGEAEAGDKMSTYMFKLLQHLRRSAHYVDKLAMEEESLESDASLRTDASKMEGVLGDFREAHELVATLSRQLHEVADASARHCRRILDHAEAEAKPPKM